MNNIKDQDPEKLTIPAGGDHHTYEVDPEQLHNDDPHDEETTLNGMGKIYRTIIGFPTYIRYLIYIVPIAILLTAPILIVAVTGNANIPLGNKPSVDGGQTFPPGPRIYQLLVWIEATWLTLWLGKVSAHVLPEIFIFFSGVIISTGGRRYISVLRTLEIPLSLFFWTLASWLIFQSLIQSEFDSVTWVDAFKKLLGAFFVSSAVLLGEKTIVHLMAITYRQRSFAARIKRSKQEISILGDIYDASLSRNPGGVNTVAEDDCIRTCMKSKSSSFIGNVERVGNMVTSAFGEVVGIAGRDVFNPNSGLSVVVKALDDRVATRAMAMRIWMSFAREPSIIKSGCHANKAVKRLFPQDILNWMNKKPLYERAKEFFKTVDTEINGGITKDRFTQRCQDIGKERKVISKSMRDISQALAMFDKVMLFIVLLIVVFIFLAFFQSSFITTLATAGTAILSLSFVFAVTAQEFLGSCIFVFVKHPYDVGDRVDIVSLEKEQLVVDKISLLYTVFQRIDTMQILQVPNIVLNNLWIENVTRSRSMKEIITLNILPIDNLELLREKINSLLAHEKLNRYFFSDAIVDVVDITDLNKMKLNIALRYKVDRHAELDRASKRSNFMQALTQALKDARIHASKTEEIQSINGGNSSV